MENELKNRLVIECRMRTMENSRLLNYHTIKKKNRENMFIFDSLDIKFTGESAMYYLAESTYGKGLNLTKEFFSKNNEIYKEFVSVSV